MNGYVLPVRVCYRNEARAAFWMMFIPPNSFRYWFRRWVNALRKLWRTR